MELHLNVRPESCIPLSGQFVKAVIDNFCMKPQKGMADFPHCSVGVDRDSIVATDSYSAILVGEDSDDHNATIRNEALLAAERGKLYSTRVDIDGIDVLTDRDTGSVRAMPPIQGIIRDEMAKMDSIAIMSPAALEAVGKVARAAGAIAVELFQPSGETDILGFEFSFAPDPGHVNLFARWDGLIKARGVFKATKSAIARVASNDPDSAKPADESAPGAKVDLNPPSRHKSARAAGDAQPAVSTPPPAPKPVDKTITFTRGNYQLPKLTILQDRRDEQSVGGEHRETLLRTLSQFNVPATMDQVVIGPRLTQYQVYVPAGSSVKKISGLAQDIQMQLGVQSVRIEAPIPGKQAVGIEIPNSQPRTVGLEELVATESFMNSDKRLLMAVGLNLHGLPVYADLAAMPHLLIAGATGAGKSIGLASLICSLLLRNTPRDLRLIMIDPKKVELTLFEGLPHLMCPVIKDVKEAPGVLRALWREMDRRYDLLSELKVRNIDGYNAKVEEADRMPAIVCVIDELADLMLQARDEVETSIARLTQLARAVGIHMIVATQRPSVDIITGLIKANIPSRIGFKVSSMIDSRVVLDENGAEVLLGRGDLLFKSNEHPGAPVRVQSAFVSEVEIEEICNYWRDQEEPTYILQMVLPDEADEIGEDDPLLKECRAWVIERGQASTSMLQRKFSIGFSRASALLDALEKAGVVGPRDGPRPREVLVTE